MKRAKYLLWFIGLLVFVSCQQNLLDSGTDKQVTPKRVVTVSHGLEVMLKPNVPLEALELTLEDYKGKFLTITRAGNSDSQINVSLERLETLYNSIENITEYPKIGGVTEKNINIIRNDFINISDQEIKEKFTEIIDIYKAQLRFELYQIISQDELHISSRGGDYPSNLSSDEFWLLFGNPWQITHTKIATEHAISFTNEKYGKSGWGDKSDAFRHAIWNVLLATYAEGNKKEKLEWAKKFSDAHENGAKKGEDWDNPMDFHNNAEGRSYFKEKAKEKDVLWWKEVVLPSVNNSKKDIYNKSQAAVQFANKSELSSLKGKLVYFK